VVARRVNGSQSIELGELKVATVIDVILAAPLHKLRKHGFDILDLELTCSTEAQEVVVIELLERT
jgi:hypothetical protein